MSFSNNLFDKFSLNDIDDSDSLDLRILKNKYSTEEIKLSLLLPTRERVDHLDKFLKSLARNTSSINNIEIIMYIDEDDFVTQKYVNDELNITRLIGPRLSMGQYNVVCYRHSVGSIVMLANDDLVVETENWDELLLYRLNKISDQVFLAFPNDGINKKSLCSFPLMSRKTCDAMVYPFPPLYKRLFIDTHIMDVFIRLNRYEKQRVIYLDDIKFTHLNLNPHIYDSDSNQRTNDDDDISFLLLRSLRSTQFKRLKSLLKNEPLPAIDSKVECIDRTMNFINLLKWFVYKFLCDKELPVIFRFKYFIRFSGHFFMIKTTIGLFLARSISVFKSETKPGY